MKRIILCLLAFAAPRLALADTTANDNNLRFEIPMAKNGAADIDNQWGNDKIASRLLTISPLFVSSGTIAVDAICVSSGVLGDFATLSDSNTATGFSAFMSSASVVDYAPTVSWSAGNAQSLGNPSAGCRNYIPALVCTKGLVFGTTTANVNAIVRYRVLRR